MINMDHLETPPGGHASSKRTSPPVRTWQLGHLSILLCAPETSLLLTDCWRWAEVKTPPPGIRSPGLRFHYVIPLNL